MKRRYDGCHMTIYGSILPGAASMANWANRVDSLTIKAKRRLKIIDWYNRHNKNQSLTSRHFGIDRKTLRQWLKRLDINGPAGLNDLSHRPKTLRQMTTSWNIIIKTVNIRKKYPSWSKYKIKVMLRREGVFTSASTIGRILKKRGLIDKKISKKRVLASRHPKLRFLQGLKIHSPGDMIQMDTKYISLIGGRKMHQFTAIDVLTKRRVLRYYSSLSSKNGADFLEHCIKTFPFLIKALQTDNGSEFLKNFHQLCKEKNISHYFIYPRHPKQNTYVETSHGADEREFYSQGIISSNIKKL